MLAEALKSLASSGLNNPSLAADADIDAAANEAIELIGDKVVDETTALDIAFYRLKIRLKIDVDESDMYLYQSALKRLADAPFKTDEGAGGNIMYRAV
ncbi:MAG: hypothetical protein LBO72_08110 [Helicobacteraceae bacterium]|jgi:hypothetical protein|nr:hypothetical protein [Helicobacteraceae bacterium]